MRGHASAEAETSPRAEPRNLFRVASSTSPANAQGLLGELPQHRISAVWARERSSWREHKRGARDVRRGDEGSVSVLCWWMNLDWAGKEYIGINAEK